MSTKDVGAPAKTGGRERQPSISLKCEGDKRRHYDFARREAISRSSKVSDGLVSISEVVFDALDFQERLLDCPDEKLVAVAREYRKKHRG